jgi:sterol desaturase/sphingolipid hydroxylase (fatty acid hydroxylase superfamily)
MPLGVAITLLLFLQWPLRDLVGAWSTQANDAAQGLFALYVAVALRHAGVRQAHLVARPDLAPVPAAPRWRRIGAAVCVLPWALAMVALAAPVAWRSVQALEGFPESLNPGYFIIKLALLLLALLLAAQALLDLARALRHAPA